MFHWFKKHTKDGLERPDETPIEVTLRDRPLTLAEQLQRFVTSEEIRERLKNRGIDTFDEADDFDIGDPEDLKSPYEEHFIGSEMRINGLQARLDEQRSGMVEEMPLERQERAKSRLNAKQPNPKGAAVADPQNEAK